MIPKVAYFYWTSPGPMPWLREQALVSFMAHHPRWEVVLGSPEVRVVPAGVRLELDTITDPALPPAARSDVWRWAMLAKGGLYADTDVLFLSSVEGLFQDQKDVWITGDLGTPVPQYGWIRNREGRLVPRVGLSIGVLASQKQSNFFRRVLALAKSTPVSEDYQSHGTKLLAKNWQAISRGISVGEIPACTFYRAGSSAKHVRKLWTETGPKFPACEFGLHWYGGSAESLPYQGIKSAEELPDCWVRKALEMVPVRM